MVAKKAKQRVTKKAASKKPAIGGSTWPVGRQIRDLRRAKRFTLQMMAERLDVSVGYLSQVERDLSKLPIGVLRAISDVLGVHINWFFPPNEGGDPEERAMVVRATNRRRMNFTNIGISEELLSPNLSGPIELLLSTIDPGADSGEYSHDGDEAGFVVEGTLELWVSGRYLRLGAGDSFAFRSRETHRCRNPGDVPTKVVWAITPPHY